MSYEMKDLQPIIIAEIVTTPSIHAKAIKFIKILV